MDGIHDREDGDREDKWGEEEDYEGLYDFDVSFMLYSAEAGMVLSTEVNMPFIPVSGYKIVLEFLDGKRIYLSVVDQIWDSRYPLQIFLRCNLICRLTEEADGDLACFHFGHMPVWLLENVMRDQRWHKELPEDIYIANIFDVKDTNGYDPNKVVSPSDSPFLLKGQDNSGLVNYDI